MDLSTRNRLMQRRLIKVRSDRGLRTIMRVSKFLERSRRQARHEAMIAAARAANWESPGGDQAAVAPTLVGVLAAMLGGGRVPGEM